MARRKETATDTPGTSKPSFEEALSSLEGIIEAMEHEHLPLEELVSNFEKGSSLLAHCESILKNARERIEVITVRNQNEIALEAGTKPADAAGFSTPNNLSDDPDDDDDIRLF
jgi:exodeoxyribonuclease VII small subunit